MQIIANNEVEKTILERHSVRAFSSKPVSDKLIRDMVNKAARAPSGTNTQPWKVYVVQGQVKQQITDKVIEAAHQLYLGLKSKSDFKAPYSYYPATWFEPYLSRRRENGAKMYQILDIAKGNRSAMHLQQLRNFKFFDAPVGLFFTTHQDLTDGAKMAVAMLMQNIMLIAKAQGLDTCPQASWNTYHEIIMPILNAKQDERFLCGMSLGYALKDQPINQFYTDREDAEQFMVFLK